MLHARFVQPLTPEQRLAMLVEAMRALAARADLDPAARQRGLASLRRAYERLLASERPTNGNPAGGRPNGPG